MSGLGLLLIGITMGVASKTDPTPSKVIVRLEQKFRSNPKAHLKEVDSVLDATARLDGALLEYQMTGDDICSKDRHPVLASVIQTQTAPQQAPTRKQYVRERIIRGDDPF